jgi:hypothetical protein
MTGQIRPQVPPGITMVWKRKRETAVGLYASVYLPSMCRSVRRRKLLLASKFPSGERPSGEE